MINQAVIDLEEMDKPKVSPEIQERTDQFFKEHDKLLVMAARINEAIAETDAVMAARLLAVQRMVEGMVHQFEIVNTLYFLEPKDEDIH